MPPTSAPRLQRFRAEIPGRLWRRAATEDMAAAISFILRNAETLGVATHAYSVWGSSAGARMAAAIGSHGVAAFGGDDVPKPAAVIMAYTAHSDVARDEPPTFVVVGEQDGIAPPSAMERRIAVLRRLGTPVEYRRFRGIGHGFGTGAGTAPKAGSRTRPASGNASSSPRNRTAHEHGRFKGR